MQPALKVTPNSYYMLHKEMYEKLEHDRRELEKIDLDKEITYFNNIKETKTFTAYDQFFSYTKTFPLFDTRKSRENRAYPRDRWENIRKQESLKAVPSTTSLNYGRRPTFDIKTGSFARFNSMKNLLGKCGMPYDKVPPHYSEEMEEFRI